MDNRMHLEPTRKRRKKNNVIAMSMDAEYFYERGVRFLQRNDLQRALKAFRKTVEFEPSNPVNHCNLAGVLSEMGDFQASNEILLHILNDLAPEMAECQFYLANNYANMGQYDVAEEYVLKYLDADPEGEYADDAEEMLDVLMDEFGGGQAFERWEQEKIAEERAAAERDGRHLLENGQFEAAVEWLERIVASEPDNTAAHNNLSLAYYYTGQQEKACELAGQVLERQPDNIHALCNLTVFMKYVGTRDGLQACVSKLQKVFPLHYDLAMKVGTTLGLVGYHKDALQLFLQLARIVHVPDPILTHSIAASAANSGEYGIARKWWKVLAQLPDVKEVALFYLEKLDEVECEGRKGFRVSYQYDLPLQVQFAEMKKRLEQTDTEVWRKDPLFRASLYWGLRNGGTETRRAVLRTLALIGDEDAQKSLRLFLKRPDVDETLQAIALVLLQRMGAVEDVEVNCNGHLKAIVLNHLSEHLILSIEPIWQTVWEITRQWFCNHGYTDLLQSAERSWLTFLHESLVNPGFRIRKPEIWVAGLVYITLRYHAVALSQKELANQFHVSPSSIRKAATRLEAVLLQCNEQNIRS